MQINFASLDTCHTATGLVVVIDVVRAFTTAAFAFAAGARRIILAGPVEQALALRERFPGALLMGESGGLLVPGFDLWNSPAQFDGWIWPARHSFSARLLVRKAWSDLPRPLTCWRPVLSPLVQPCVRSNACVPSG